jgi:hypothetical protein
MSNSAVDDLVGDADPEPPGVIEGMTREEREDEFFRLLHTGCTVRQAAKAVAVNFTTMYRKRLADPEFAKRWENAQRIKVEHLVREAERRAMCGSDKLLMFLLQAADPVRFRNHQSLDVTNSDGSLQPADGDSDRASRTAAMLAMARARKTAKELADLV